MANWMLMPVIDCLAYTRDAVADCLAQEGVDPHVLIIDNGSGEEARVGSISSRLIMKGACSCGITTPVCRA